MNPSLSVIVPLYNEELAFSAVAVNLARVFTPIDRF
jgi:glycosyltransferase involved in cell wall biosynthesis